MAKDAKDSTNETTISIEYPHTHLEARGVTSGIPHHRALERNALFRRTPSSTLTQSGLLRSPTWHRCAGKPWFPTACHRGNLSPSRSLVAISRMLPGTLQRHSALKQIITLTPVESVARSLLRHLGRCGSRAPTAHATQNRLMNRDQGAVAATLNHWFAEDLHPFDLNKSTQERQSGSTILARDGIQKIPSEVGTYEPRHLEN